MDDGRSQSVQPLAMSALDYELPESLIATRPAEPRTAARLMVVSCQSPDASPIHTTIAQLPEFLESGDCLCFNTTSVLPARVRGQRADTGGKVEGLYLTSTAATTWSMMLKSNGRLRAGMVIQFDAEDGRDSCVVELQAKGDDGTWKVAVRDPRATEEILGSIGRTPLPPYILRARQSDAESSSISDSMDRLWYQTVYADPDRAGSVAAPTAGLHFTEDLLETLRSGGVGRCDVTLHVGAGTFKPVEASTLEEHPMHFESWRVDPAAVDTMLAVRESGGRLIAVGTTTVRTLESLPRPLARVSDSLRGSTDLLISPGYSFALVDGLLTNFHLPRSTLLALVAAKLGLDRTMALYASAVESGYRFYSYGDAMLILP